MILIVSLMMAILLFTLKLTVLTFRACGKLAKALCIFLILPAAALCIWIGGLLLLALPLLILAGLGFYAYTCRRNRRYTELR